jgi:DNA-binding transcriptional regulator YiaG
LTIGNFELEAKIPLPDGIKAYPITLGDHLKKARFERKLQQIEVARMLNVDYSTVRRWEENEVKITTMYLERVKEFLGYDI